MTFYEALLTTMFVMGAAIIILGALAATASAFYAFTGWRKGPR